jgi:hypothetical protein
MVRARCANPMVGHFRGVVREPLLYFGRPVQVKRRLLYRWKQINIREWQKKRCLIAKNSLFIFGDLAYQKEMEVASLEFQVRAYRCKFLSMGCNDLGAYDYRFPEDMFLQRSDSCKMETDASIDIRLKQNTEHEFNVHNLDFEKKLGNSIGGTFDSYWKEIKKLDGRVKEISDCKASGRGSLPRSGPRTLPRTCLRRVTQLRLVDECPDFRSSCSSTVDVGTNYEGSPRKFLLLCASSEKRG